MENTTAYGYCGMPCALCSRHHISGESRCLGCSQGGYYTDVCKAYSCCRERGLLHCGECQSYPCAQLGKMSDFRDLDTGGAKCKNCELVASGGFDAWHGELSERAAMLREALESYNDGRMKRYLCELFIKCDIEKLKELMKRASGISGDKKQAGKAFKQLAEAVREKTDA